MGGLRVRVSANQPRPARIRRDFSHDADHLWGTGAFLLRQGHYVHTTTGGRHVGGRAASAEPRLPRLDAGPTSAAGSTLGMSQSAVFEYDSPGTHVVPQQVTKREAKQLPAPDARASPTSAQVLRNLDRYMERWAQVQSPPPPPVRSQRALSPTRRTATEVGAELALRMAVSSAGSASEMVRQSSPSRMRDRQTSAAYSARVARVRR